LNRIAVGESDTCLKLTGNARVLVTLVIIRQVGKYTCLQWFSPVPVDYSLQCNV
jgi:hypothetical protein